jgi:hypothetical protein
MESVRSLIGLYEFTPGRAIFCVQGTRKEATKRQLPDLVAVCDVTLDASHKFFDATAAWERTKNVPKARGEGEAVALDPLLDKAVSGLYDGAANFSRSLSANHDLSVLAQQFTRKAFPRGPAGITTLAFEDESVAVKNLLKRCDDPQDLGSFVAKLNLSPFVEEIRARSVQFEAALRKTSPAEISWGKVKEAGAETQERLAELVVKIAGTYNLRTDEHIAARAALLGPIMEQNERIAQARKHRRPVTDVDPSTGLDTPTQPTDPTQPTQPTDHG